MTDTKSTARAWERLDHERLLGFRNLVLTSRRQPDRKDYDTLFTKQGQETTA